MRKKAISVRWPWGNRSINRLKVRHACDSNGGGKIYPGRKSVEETFTEARAGRKASCPLLLNYYALGYFFPIHLMASRCP